MMPRALSLLSRIFPKGSDWRYRGLLLAAMLWRRLLVGTKVIALTGSVGKTTTKELLAAMLGEIGPVVASVGTANTVRSVAYTILRARRRHRFLVVETGTDRPGWIRRAALVARPDIAIVLNVAGTHIRRFETLDDTAREKACLVKGMKRKGTAVLNGDDPRVAAMAGMSKGRVVYFGAGEECAVRAEDVSACWPERLSLTLCAGGVRQHVQTRLVGTHWVNGLLAAAAAALECGATLPQIAAGVARVEPTAGRLQPCVLPSGAVMLRDDFNGSLESYRAAFEVLRNARARRKILAITSVSDTHESWGARLKRIAGEASQAADELILIGKPDDVRKSVRAALDGGIRPECLHRCGGLAAAAEFLRSHLREGDLVLLRGTTTDHVTRIFHAQTRTVECWADHCGKTVLCDDCPQLFGSKLPRDGASAGEVKWPVER